MTGSAVAVAAVFVVHALRLGPMRLTAYGLCAAAGLVLAMAAARRCARIGGLDPEWAWDAGIFAIASCFVASRLLLVAFDVKAFLRFPLLVLSLPSLTFAGMAIAAVMVWVYLRRKRLSVLRMLDVFAAPAAILAAFLELGHALDGSELGMPWSFQPDGDVARLHPVAAYGVVVSGLLAVLLWRVQTRPVRQGTAAAVGLLLGGLAAFGLGMLTQPSLLFDGWLIEPGQVVALMAMAAGAVLWALRPAKGVMNAWEPAQSDQNVPAGSGQEQGHPASGLPAHEPLHGEVR